MKMNRFICRTLNSLHFDNSPRLYKPPFLSSISLLFFSSSPSEKKLKTKINLSDYLINQHFSRESALEASSIKHCLKNPQNSDLVLSFLKENGFSRTHLEKIVVKTPSLLSVNLDTTLKPKIKIFQDFGFSSTEIADLISADPWVLQRSADNQIRQSILVLKSIFGSNADVYKALKICGWFLKRDLEKTLMPSMEFLKSCGISSSQIVKYVFYYPTFFLLKPERIKDVVQRADEMGFDRKSKMFLPAIRTLSSMSMERWEFKLKLFRSLGFSECDILSMFRCMPPAFAASERKIRQVTEILLSRGDVDISFIVNNPSLLLASINCSLTPRLCVYDLLKSKNLLPKKTSLSTLCTMSKRNFLDKFVLPYRDEIGDLSFPGMAQSQ